MYIAALCEGLFEEPLDSKLIEIRAVLNQRLEKEGRDALYDELASVDAVSAQKYADKNPRRVLRALEYYLVNHFPISQAHDVHVEPSKYEVTYFTIEIERDTLNERINKRTSAMWNNGLLQECELLLSMGFTSDLHSLNAVGYREAMQHLKKEITFDEGLRLTAQNTQRYAKRQRTWMTNQIPDRIGLSGTTEEIASTMERTILQHTKEAG